MYTHSIQKENRQGNRQISKENTRTTKSHRNPERILENPCMKMTRLIFKISFNTSPQANRITSYRLNDNVNPNEHLLSPLCLHQHTRPKT